VEIRFISAILAAPDFFNAQQGGYRHYYQADSKCLQQILQKFALRHLFLDESEPEVIQRLNKSLDIEWAMDIKNNPIKPQ